MYLIQLYVFDKPLCIPSDLLLKHGAKNSTVPVPCVEEFLVLQGIASVRQEIHTLLGRKEHQNWNNIIQVVFLFS
jgi:hypothetical protein